MASLKTLIALAGLAAVSPIAALPPELATVATKSPLTSFVVPPKRIVWKSGTGVENSSNFLTANEVVPKSLDLTRDITPVTSWMNGISTYSMWWIP